MSGPQSSILGTLVAGTICTVGGGAAGAIVGTALGFATTPAAGITKTEHVLSSVFKHAGRWSTVGFGVFVGREVGYRKGVTACTALPAAAPAPLQTTA